MELYTVFSYTCHSCRIPALLVIGHVGISFRQTILHSKNKLQMCINEALWDCMCVTNTRQVKLDIDTFFGLIFCKWNKSVSSFLVNYRGIVHDKHIDGRTYLKRLMTISPYKSWSLLRYGFSFEMLSRQELLPVSDGCKQWLTIIAYRSQSYLNRIRVCHKCVCSWMSCMLMPSTTFSHDNRLVVNIDHLN
jgi:hypothetical protein